MSRRHLARLLILASAAALTVFVTSAVADPPDAFPITDSFVDVNPCTGDLHTVTVTGTFYVFERGQGISHNFDHTVTTSSGFAGAGIEVSIDHDRIFHIRDVLSNPVTGQKILAHLLVVHDASGTVRVESFELTCIPK
jgi:hypothetical protein